METTKNGNRTAEFADKIYKNMKMGSDSVLSLLPKVDNEDLRSTMTAQLDGYEQFATRARTVLQKEDVKPTEENVMTRVGAKMGMTFNTLIDQTASHIAEMMIQGSTMGITDTIKLLRDYENKPLDDSLQGLAREIIRFEEENVEKMKKFL